MDSYKLKGKLSDLPFYLQNTIKNIPKNLKPDSNIYPQKSKVDCLPYIEILEELLDAEIRESLMREIKIARPTLFDTLEAHSSTLGDTLLPKYDADYVESKPTNTLDGLRGYFQYIGFDTYIPIQIEANDFEIYISDTPKSPKGMSESYFHLQNTLRPSKKIK